MDNLSTSLILLVVALVLLWLAVTDRLSRALDAYDVLTGKATSSGASVSPATGPGAVVNFPKVTLSLPALPKVGSNVQVGI